MGMSVNGGGPGDGDDVAYRPLSEINITPFVDVMLVLLIIFMVAAPLMVAGVPVDLPNTSAAKLSNPKKPMVVSLAADGNLYVREETVTRETLVDKLRELKAVEGDTVVYVRADKSRPYGDVMELLGRVGESGYQRVSLLSQPKASEGGRVLDSPSPPASLAPVPSSN
ncbi:MAG: biopolymer transporter ExbD [Hyphomicrobiaceae bacterium]|nr:biopolymer transporter ExbD [Hyphomicrobiaceae bacterium]